MSRCFVSRQLPGDALARLSEHHEVSVWPGDLPPSRAELAEACSAVDGLISLLTDQVDAALLESATNLKVVSNYAVGSDNVDLSEAGRRGVAVGVTPDVLTTATADIAIGLLISVARRLPEAMSDVAAGRWRTWEPRRWLGLELTGATLVIVGAGRIGGATAARAKTFGMNVELVGRGDDLHDALSRADVVSLHVPLSSATRHLIDRSALRAMKPSALLINTARGGLVDQAALLTALTEGRLGGAGLDVTDPEPMPADHPLLRAPNTVVLPHIGSATHKAREKMAELTVDNLLAGLAGDPLPYPATALSAAGISCSLSG
jgi:glyoxylate reductase